MLIVSPPVRARVFRPKWAIAALAALMACGSDIVAPKKADDMNGSYHLVAVNGSSLSYIAPHSPLAFVIDSATMELGAGGTYVERMYGSSDTSETIGFATAKADHLILLDQGAWGMNGDAVLGFASLVNGLSGASYLGNATLTRFKTTVTGPFVGTTLPENTMVWQRDR